MRADAQIRIRSLLGLAFLVAVLAVALFASAGTVRYPQAWAFLAVFAASSLAITLYLMARDPALLRRRVRGGPAAEQHARQRLIQAAASIAFLAMMIASALDHRLGWSRVPPLLVALGDCLVALGFSLVFLVFKENTFASATIETPPEQRVVDTGPYAQVRHPMYAGALILLAGVPLALGSFWGLLALAPMSATIVARLLDEERVLSSSLPGYGAYLRHVRYRLVPRVW